MTGRSIPIAGFLVYSRARPGDAVAPTKYITGRSIPIEGYWLAALVISGMLSPLQDNYDRAKHPDRKFPCL